MKTKNQDHIDYFKSLRRKVKKLIHIKYTDYLNNLADSVEKEPKKFWSFYSTKTKTRKLPLAIKRNKDDINPVTSSYSKANLFNEYFHSVYSHINAEPLPPESHPIVPIHELSTIAVSVSEVKSIFKNLDASKSPGPDGITARLLKEAALEISDSVASIFNKSLTTGVFPEKWKVSHLTPVFKSGQKDVVTNYRGISLLSIMSKGLERCVHTHIYSHVEDLLHPDQHAFRKQKSCVAQLVQYVHSLAKTLDSGGQTDVIYLDMAKAFDRVPHEKLMYKLEMFELRNPLLAWIKDYLTNRHHRVIIEGTTSDWKPVTSGVPQGSIIGPILFLVYINDIAENLSAGTSLPLYPDDAKCARVINDLNDCYTLQNDLTAIHDWSKLWEMNFNLQKCKQLCITRKKKPIYNIYHLGMEQLLQTDKEKDLGIMLHHKLAWHDHIITKVNTANKILRLIRRTCGNQTQSVVIRKLYIHLVRPHLEYACEIWSPHQAFLQDMIESVQRRATRLMIKGKSYTERLKSLHLLTLKSRRTLLDLIFFYVFKWTLTH